MKKIKVTMNTANKSPGPWFNIKMTSYQYRKSHCGDKTILRPSYLHNEISYTGKTTSLYWIGALLTAMLLYLFRASAVTLSPICTAIWIRRMAAWLSLTRVPCLNTWSSGVPRIVSASQVIMTMSCTGSGELYGQSCTHRTQMSHNAYCRSLVGATVLIWYLFILLSHC